MITVGGRGAMVSRCAAPPSSSTSSPWTIFTTCWPGREALEDLVPDGLLADTLDEGADDLEVDVGLEEGDAHLAERLLDVLLAQAAGAPEAVENRLETLRQGFEHWILSESRGGIAKST